MILDKESTFSQEQVVTASAVSTNIIDQGGPSDVGVSEPTFLCITVTEAALAAGAATVEIQLQCDDNAAFSSPKMVMSTGAMPKATLAAGYQTFIPMPIGLDERFLRANFVVAAGPLTAGKFSLNVVHRIQKVKAYADAI